ncbi:MAG: heparan-alpha-glucosaminide N-acetyltransferase domain-containing protein [Candidatus Omnitrophota bacterium]
MTITEKTERTEKKRFAFIDQYRGWAVLFMIETHVLNAFLLPSLFPTRWYRAVSFTNGIVAPSFLFLAGFSFAIVALRKWQDLLALNSVFWKQLGRYLLILLIAYTLHIPGNSFHILFNQLKWNENHLFWGVDILHCIAVSLILMLLSMLLIRHQKRLFIGFGILGTAIALSTPLVHSLPITSMVAAPFAGYFKRIYWSQFPLFPWMGFLLLGAATSFLWQQVRQTSGENAFFKYGALVSAGMTASIFIITFRHADFNPIHPPFFFMKLGIVGMLLSFFYWLEQKRQTLPALITRMGQESLLAYAFHIFIIYGILWNFGKHGPLMIMVVTLLLITATVLVCLAWQAMKQTKPRLARWIFLGFWGAVMVIHLLIK